MQNHYIPAVTMLSAGAIVSIFCIIKKVDVLYSLKLLLVMLVVFYIIGLIAKKIMGRIEEDANFLYAERMREQERLEREEREARERAEYEESEELN